MTVVLLPVAFVERVVIPFVGAKTVLHVGLPLALLGAAIAPLEEAFAVQLVIGLIAFVVAAGLHGVLTGAILVAIFEVAFLDAAVRVGFFAFAVLFVALPFAFLHAASGGYSGAGAIALVV